MIVELKVQNIVIPQGLLPRVLTGTIAEVVEKYKQMMEDGVEFDPIKVWKKGREYWVVDGVHRLEAVKQLGKEIIKAEVVELADEQEYRIAAIKANLKHGVALAEAEKKILAQILFEEGLSKEEIRKIFGVGEKALTRWLSDKLKEKVIEMKEEGLSNREIARRLGICSKTVDNWVNDFDQMKNSGCVILSKLRTLGNNSQSEVTEPESSLRSEGETEAEAQKVERIEVVVGETRKEQIPEEQAKLIIEQTIALLKNPAYEFISWAKVARDLIELHPNWEKSPGLFKLENFLIRNSSALITHYQSVPVARPEHYSPLIERHVKEVFGELGKKIKNDKGVRDFIQDKVENELIKMGLRITSDVRRHIKECIEDEILTLLYPPEKYEAEVKPKEVKKEPEYQDPSTYLKDCVKAIQKYFLLIIDKFGWETAEKVADEISEDIYNRDVRDWEIRALLYVERKIRLPYDRCYREH